MQNKAFRRRYINTIPEDAPKPYYVGDRREKLGILAGFGEFPLFFAGQMKDRGYEVYVVSIEDEDGNEMVLAYLNKGQFFGEMGLFYEQPTRSAWVRTRTSLAVALWGAYRPISWSNSRPKGQNIRPNHTRLPPRESAKTFQGGRSFGPQS